MNLLNDHLKNEAAYLKKEEANIRQFAKKRIKEIKELIKVESILDCGSSWGYYLDEYEKEGWEAWGVEKSWYYPVRDKVKNISLEEVEANTFKFKQFDVITGFCVFEHIIPICSVIYNLSKLLRKDGLLVMKAPYKWGWTGRFAPEKYYLDPTHVNEIDEKFIENNILIYGFKIIKIVIEGVHPERVFPRFGKTKIAKYLTEKLGLGDARCWFLMKEN